MKKKREEKTYKKILIVSVIFVIIFLMLMIISQRTKDYREVELKENKKSIFSIVDLKVGKVEFSEKEEEVKKELGEPKKEKEYEKNNLKYKKLYYKGLEITLRENYKEYMVVGAKITSKKYETSRKVKVGQKITKVMKKYKIDNKKGIYLYGNYSKNALTSKEITSTIYMGVRGKKEVTYIYRDEVIEGTKTNIARLTLTYKSGKVKEIEWLYDYE